MPFLCYKITNLVNDKIYIGICSNSISHRFSQHKYDAKTKNTPLHSAIRKYGYENFNIEILDTKDTWEEICDIEKDYIISFNSLTKNGNGYNIGKGGEGAFGVERSDTTKAKLSEITKKQMTPEAKAYLSKVATEQMSDPANREMSRQGALKQMSDPNMKEKSLRGLKKYYKENPEMRSIQQKKIMSDPKIVNNIRTKALKQMSNPENRELSRQGALKQWENMSDEERKRRAEGMRLRSLKFNADPKKKELKGRKNFKKVIAYGIIYESVNACAEAFGVKANTITCRCQSKHNSDFYYSNKNSKTK